MDYPFLDAEVPVILLEEFLDTVSAGIRFLIGWYQDMIARKSDSKQSTPESSGPYRQLG